MDAGVYAAEAALEEHHWWFQTRRRLFGREIGQLGIHQRARVLDIGTSTGTNLRLLRELGMRDVTGIDANDEAIRFCADKGLGTVRKGDICALPFASDTFDLVLATDVVEHVDDDGKALCEIARVLAPGGKALITVPAFEMLWGFQDDASGHKRRYRMAPLLQLLCDAGLRVRRRYHFNFLLFLPILLARQLIRGLRPNLRSESEINTPLINTILRAVFGFDAWIAGWLRPPFGVSILVTVEKPTP